MSKPSPFLWLAILLILLLPSTAGKFFLDVAGGLMILIFLLPILLTGAGWIGWKLLQSKLTSCTSCGTSFFNTLEACPICGQQYSSDKKNSTKNSIPASSVTIDVTPEKDI